MNVYCSYELIQEHGTVREWNEHRYEAFATTSPNDSHQAVHCGSFPSNALNLNLFARHSLCTGFPQLAGM